MTDPQTTVVCRQINCGAQVVRTQAVPARKVLSNPKARGFFCPRCASFWKRWRG